MEIAFPFLHPDYLSLLESSGAVSLVTGWDACPPSLAMADSFLPLYRKHHSRGEYVFDQGWAQAWHRYGQAYYPKLLTAVPFTPVQGPRWRGSLDLTDVLEVVREQLVREQASSWHLLFVEPELKVQGERLGLIPRAGCHFEWYNRGYGCFQDFLSVLHSAKRKTLRKERQRVAEGVPEVQVRCLQHIPMVDWLRFYECYAMTYYERGQQPYLPAAFFVGLKQSALAAQVYLVSAHDDDGLFAGALFFADRQKLYGRYWGCLNNIPGLHFELCFYRGMELCIELGLSAFDPGVQGEHKLIRGFEPVLRWSLHEVRDPRFREAVRHFCDGERLQVDEYYRQARELLPFRH